MNLGLVTGTVIRVVQYDENAAAVWVRIGGSRRRKNNKRIQFVNALKIAAANGPAVDAIVALKEGDLIESRCNLQGIFDEQYERTCDEDDFPIEDLLNDDEISAEGLRVELKAVSIVKIGRAAL